jgi:hypothetical protein
MDISYLIESNIDAGHKNSTAVSNFKQKMVVAMGYST